MFSRNRAQCQKAEEQHRGKRQLEKNGKKILWSHWEEAYLWDQSNNSYPINERLKDEHFHLTPSSRMRNALTEDVLDKRMLLFMQVGTGFADFCILNVFIKFFVLSQNYGCKIKFFIRFSK